MVLFLAYCGLAVYQSVTGDFPAATWGIVQVIFLFGLFMWFCHILFTDVNPKHVNSLINDKARYEAALYRLLAAVVDEEAQEEKVRLIEAYLKHLRAEGLDNEEHLRNLPSKVAETVYEICHGLIKKEKAELAQKLQNDIGGSSIENHGNDISRLEAIANCVRPMPKISAYNVPSLFPDATGMSIEA